MTGGSFGVDLLPGGVYGFIRRRIQQDGELKIHLQLDRDAGLWRSKSNWKPFTGIEAATPEALLIKIAQMLEPGEDDDKLVKAGWKES